MASNQPQDEMEPLRQTWKTLGPVITVKPFDHHSKSTVQKLLDMAQKLDTNLVTRKNCGGSSRLLVRSKPDSKNSRNVACRKMLLKSEHNDLATAAELHLKHKYNAKMVYGACTESHTSALQSVMSCIDNVLDDYAFYYCMRALLHKLVMGWQTIIPLHQRHLDKTSRSYQKLCIDLTEDKEINAATDFFVAVLRVMYDIPILLVQPRKITHPSGKEDFIFEEDVCIEADRLLNQCDFKISLLFNGLNHYTPFYSTKIGDIVNDGRPVSSSVVKVYSSVWDLLPRIPNDSSLHGTVNQMYRLLRYLLHF